jgi:hypothetical protein
MLVHDGFDFDLNLNFQREREIRRERPDERDQREIWNVQPSATPHDENSLHKKKLVERH